MRLVIGLALTTLCFLVPSTASGQVCAGSASFGDSPAQLGLGATLANGAKGYHATIGLGGKPVFGGVGLAYLRPDNLDQASKGVVFFGGAEFGGGRVYACPIADYEYMKLPDVGTVEVTGTAFAIGGRLGVIAVDGPVKVIPSFGFFRSRETLTGKTATSEGSETNTFGLWEFGIGFPGRRFGFGATYLIPVQNPGAPNQLRLGISFLF